MALLYDAIVLLLVIFSSCSCVAQQDSGELPSRLAVPRIQEHLKSTHHLSKREVCQVFYLNEPPSLLQCNPQADSILTLRCEFLVGNVIRTAPIPVTIGWFFSSDGVVGELVQTTQFMSRRRFSAFENVLVVQNALPGAYFCSSSLLRNVFDSNALRVDEETLQDVCQLGENPILRGNNAPRCAQRNIPTPNVIPSPIERESATNTINLGEGNIEVITPTYTILFERTMNIPPEATPLAIVGTEAVVETEPVAGGTNGTVIGIAVGVVVGVVLLLMLVTALLIGAIFFIKKKERKQVSPKPPCLLTQMNIIKSNGEPLLKPPNRPPPVLQTSSSHEHIEMDMYVPPENTIPRPYERVSPVSPRYESSPASNDSLTASSVNTTPQPQVEVVQRDDDSVYYSRPKFFPSSAMTYSTSTHVYGDFGSNESALYSSADNLEPYSPIASPKEVTEKELMLSVIEESTEHNSDCPSGSEEGSLLENDVDNFTEYSIDDLSIEIETNGKTPETGEVTSVEYANVNHELDIPELLGKETSKEHEVQYVNTRMNPGEKSKSNPSNQSTKRAPSGSGKKKPKILKRNKSTRVSEESGYTSLARDTFNYTSVYVTTSTIEHSTTLLPREN